jgi:hypothetical protein
MGDLAQTARAEYDSLIKRLESKEDEVAVLKRKLTLLECS